MSESAAQAWNDGSGRFHAATEGVDDVAFIGALIDRIGESCRIEAGRIFVTGFSNGASMAFGGKDQGGAEKPAVQTFIDRGPCDVVFVTVEDLGHHWPGGERQVAEFLVGRYNRKLKATDEIWNFFKLRQKR